jgi:preprotein translocase subunit SecF
MNIIGKSKLFFIITAVLSIIFIVSLVTVGLKTGVDFSAGTLFTIKFDKAVDRDSLRAQLDTMGYQSATIEPSQNSLYYIRTLQLNQTQINDFQSALTAKFGTSKVNFETVDPVVASEAVRNAGGAVLAAVGAMLLYIAWAFRKMPNPFKFGVCAVAGLAFDVVVVAGIYSVLGKLLNWQVDLMFISGILAVLGFSINNTIIVFDRIRENTGRGISSDIEVVANASIVQTLGRSFNSSLTALFTLVVLILFVGSTIQNFVVVLMIGVISGVYTSTFLSPELLVAWQKRSQKGGKSPKLSPANAKS